MAFIGYPFTSNVEEDEHGRPRYDRAVSAETLQDLNKKDRSNGVVMLNESMACKVSATSPASRIVTVAAGYCFIEGVIAVNNEPVTLTIEEASPTLQRIDTIVLRLDKRANYRSVDAYVVKGTPASIAPTVPSLTRTSEIYELGIANIFIPAASSTVQEQHITDTRLDSARCGESLPLQAIDTTALFAQIQDQVTRNLDLIRAALDETMAGYLQNQIDGITIKIPSDASSSNKVLTKTSQYEVGSVVLRTDNQSPADLYGGTWTKVEIGRYLMSGTPGESGGNTKHSHGSYGHHNGTLQATIGAVDNNQASIGYVAEGIQKSMYTSYYTITGNYWGGTHRFNHWTPIYGATAEVDNNPLYFAFAVWYKISD